MKCLTIIVDDRELFSGEVAELHWAENDEQVSVTAKFKSSPSLVEQLQAVAEKNRLNQSDSVDPRQPISAAMRDAIERARTRHRDLMLDSAEDNGAAR